MAMTEPYDENAATDAAVDTPIEADPADVAEQQAAIDDPGLVTLSNDPEVDRADAAEQSLVVGSDEEYPHDAESG